MAIIINFIVHLPRILSVISFKEMFPFCPRILANTFSFSLGYKSVGNSYEIYFVWIEAFMKNLLGCPEKYDSLYFIGFLLFVQLCGKCHKINMLKLEC